MNALTLAVLSSILSIAVYLAPGPSTVFAQAVAAPTNVTVNPAAPASARGQLAVSARLATADGKPLSSQEIDFYVPVELFGSREAFIGTATTDSTGLATLGYQPSQVGPQRIVARFVGSPDYAASEAGLDIQVKEVAPVYRDEPLPFAGLREWLPASLVGVVLIVWAVLLGVFFGTVRGIRRAA